MTRTELPRVARTAMFVLRGGLALSAAGIVGFLLSYRQVAAPALAAADVHPMPPLAWASIVAWVAGIGIALGARWYAAAAAAARAERMAADEAGPSAEKE